MSNAEIEFQSFAKLLKLLSHITFATIFPQINRKSSLFFCANKKNVMSDKIKP